MSELDVGVRVRVLHSRVHPHPGRVIELLPVRVRVEFPTGGYGGTPYRDDFHPTQLERLGDMDDTIAPGQVWQRKPAGFLYRITEVGDGGFAQDIVLTNLHNPRISRISPAGLRAKFTRRADLDTDPSQSG